MSAVALPPPRFDYGDVVRVLRNVRNDGTYPGEKTGTLLIRRGSTGVVRDVGTFLQDQVIYTVHFTDEDRIVGCRDRELLSIEEDWTPSRYEYGEVVTARLALGIKGNVIVEEGAKGEILKVLRDAATLEAVGSVAYHVRFPGRTLLVPESALEDCVVGDGHDW
ncbi:MULTISPECIES: nitrogen fixation protein NifZ [Cohaesibacter]|uniref:nitrogen fixation protein NifZ n=1 Tax=Cohaesibacter TaxID=655352 RepID=UPI000DEB1907|nr:MULTISPECIES: nitrogen fixation protein NifZ [Cohaesibacter]TLP44240.1 nitrogen fixation protein NifZ [Cohaesibacter sp. CAU 1516]